VIQTVEHVMSNNRLNLIRSTLENQLSPTKLEIYDESDLHIGHAGAESGKGHFRILVVSQKFAGLSQISRQRLVYKALADLMESDIHALSMSTVAPDEN